MAPRILVSACLLGQPVRHDGRALAWESAMLSGWRRRGMVVPLCPEVAAGFPTPRPPAEIEPGLSGADAGAGRARVLEDTGRNATEGFRRAARIAVETAAAAGCRFALLTDGSPSCGSTFIYSGRHDGQRRPGQGIVAAALGRAGVRVFAQHQIGDLAARLREEAACGDR